MLPPAMSGLLGWADPTAPAVYASSALQVRRTTPILRKPRMTLSFVPKPLSKAGRDCGCRSSHMTHQAPLCKEACAALATAVAAATLAKVQATDPVAAVLSALSADTMPYTDYAGMLSAMLEAGPELQPAVDAMNMVVPQNALFKTQGHDGNGRYLHGEITMFPPHSAGFAIYGFVLRPTVCYVAHLLPVSAIAFA